MPPQEALKRLPVHNSSGPLIIPSKGSHQHTPGNTQFLDSDNQTYYNSLGPIKILEALTNNTQWLVINSTPYAIYFTSMA